jgi:methionine-S-sulfoxide reductase
MMFLVLVLALASVSAQGSSELNKEDFEDKTSVYKASAGSDYDEFYPSAVFAGGCFWGVEYMFESQPGVVDAVSGYTGGTLEFPTYGRVISGQTGHVEAVSVWYDPEVTSYRELAKYFFEIHDPTQTDGQGPDIGSQYLSKIFYENEQEREIANELIGILEAEGYDVATEVEERTTFYRAEGYHQNYYQEKGTAPYCHAYVKRFPD